MSAIYFATPDKQAALSGRERAYMQFVCNNLLNISLGIGHRFATAEWLRPMVPDFKTSTKDELAGDLAAWLGYGGGSLLVDGREVDAFCLGLNTALVFGNDAVKLMARIHGQCEIHCYVEGPNRPWLAGIIRAGRDTGVLSNNVGWEGVAELMEESASEPVICSNSVCGEFPHPGLLPVEVDEDDGFYGLPEEARWRLCLSTLRTRKYLELSPHDWADIRFNHCLSGFDIRERQ